MKDFKDAVLCISLMKQSNLRGGKEMHHCFTARLCDVLMLPDVVESLPKYECQR